MNGQKHSRSTFFKQLLATGLLFTGTPLLLLSCNSNGSSRQNKAADVPQTSKDSPAIDPCEDFSQVEQAEIDKRNALGYVRESPLPDKQCDNCKLWIPPAAGKECGGCMLFKGPVYADAHCTYWAPQEV